MTAIRTRLDNWQPVTFAGLAVYNRAQRVCSDALVASPVPDAGDPPQRRSRLGSAPRGGYEPRGPSGGAAAGELGDRVGVDPSARRRGGPLEPRLRLEQLEGIASLGS